MKIKFSHMHLLFAVASAFVIGSCASIGRPEGGPRDEDPPVFVSSRPAPGQLNFDGNRLTLFFDENIQLDDPFNKVVVSPVQIQPPAVSANGRRVTVEFRDTLKPDMTYTVDFADAIKDLNEGNILDGFAIDFSTGDSIDSLRISGMVLEARNLEPAQGMLVGVYSNPDDSAITTLPFERIARTNQYGQFTIRNLKPGNYRVYAINDLNRDYHWDRSENVAFYDVTVSPSTEHISVSDTLRAADGSDSTVTRPGIRYLPNDILLTWFNQNYLPQYLKDYSRPERRQIYLKFAAPADSLPEITIASERNRGRDISEWALVQKTEKLDSLIYWITDTTVLNTDSLMLAVNYLKTDTNDMLSPQTDTLRFYFRDPKPAKKKKDKDKEKEDSVVTDSAGVPQPKDFLGLKLTSGTTQDVYKPLTFEADQPVDTIIQRMIKLEIKEDTLWLPAVKGEMRPDSLLPLLAFNIDVEWKPGAQYRLTVDSTAVTGIYGHWNKPLRQEIKVKQLEDYSNLVFNISGLASDSAGLKENAVVELLDNGDKPVATATVKDGRATFKWFEPGTYYARLYLDANGNGEWDTGNLPDKLQPEEVYYYNKKLTLKKNWDIEQNWDIYAEAVDRQKPSAIKKNKPKLKNGEQEQQEPEYDEFGNPIDPEDGYYDRNNPNNLNNRRPGNNNFGGFGGFGGNQGIRPNTGNVGRNTRR